MRLLTYKSRPISMGPLPLETLKRKETVDIFAIWARPSPSH